MAGQVASSTDDRFREGQAVIAHGHDLGVGHHGGLSERGRVPADWVVGQPEGLTTREAMILGTAGFTAGLSLHKLEERGLEPANGPVLVTGATGGVGSSAVAILAARGYDVHASTGKDDAHDWLRTVGASEVLGRSDVEQHAERPLSKQLWAATIDSVGGNTLAGALTATNYGGAVAASGLTGGVKIPTTVMPFILRGVALLELGDAPARAAPTRLEPARFRLPTSRPRAPRRRRDRPGWRRGRPEGATGRRRARPQARPPVDASQPRPRARAARRPAAAHARSCRDADASAGRAAGAH